MQQNRVCGPRVAEVTIVVSVKGFGIATLSLSGAEASSELFEKITEDSKELDKEHSYCTFL